MTSSAWDIASPAHEARRPLMTGDRPNPEPERQSWSSLPWPPPRPRDFTQEQARVERQQGWLVHYLDFDARVEVEQQCGPLAVEVSALLAGGVRLLDQRFYRILDQSPIVQVDPLDDVRNIAVSVHLLRLELVKVLAGLRPSQLPDGARDRLRATVSARAHAQAPEVSEADLVSGAWVSRLIEHVEPFSADLAAVVAAQPAGVSDLDMAISEAIQMPGRGDGFATRVRQLAHRLPALRSRYAGAVGAKQAAAAAVAAAERERQEQALRALRLQ